MVRKRMHRVVGFCSGVIRLNPSYFAFLSGAFISISINLLTSLVFSNPPARQEPLVWGVTGTFLIASIALAMLTSHIENPHQHWIVHWRDARTRYVLKEIDVIQGAIGSKAVLIAVELVVGLIAAVIGIGLLVILAATR